jgi:hypothetical protein
LASNFSSFFGWSDGAVSPFSIARTTLRNFARGLFIDMFGF